jgi:dTDP-4-dehydrorhamnose 3,5-epimerase-like enzyme
MAAGAHLAPRVRVVADEVWALLDGEIDVVMHDEREDSPTRGTRVHLHLHEPTLVLVPFGVQSEVSSPGAPSWIVRMATHTDSEDPIAAAPK